MDALLWCSPRPSWRGSGRPSGATGPSSRPLKGSGPAPASPPMKPLRLVLSVLFHSLRALGRSHSDASAGQAEAGHGGSQAHRPDGLRESDLGCAAHPRRARQARLQRLRADRVAVPAADPAGQGECSESGGHSFGITARRWRRWISSRLSVLTTRPRHRC